MEVFEAIRTLLAVRSYQDKPVPDDDLTFDIDFLTTLSDDV
jgi:hypothetical protein